MRFSIILVGAVATIMALTVKSIYGLWYLSSDLVYVILFPQLVCVVYFKRHCNTYGSLAAYIIGCLLRAIGGEQTIGLPVIFKYPWYSEEHGQLFPFRTFAMLSSFGTLIGVSTFTKYVFESGLLPANYDYFRCVVNIPDDVVIVGEPQEGELSVLNLSMAKNYQLAEINGRINPALVADDDPDDPATRNNNNVSISNNNNSNSICESRKISLGSEPKYDSYIEPTRSKTSLYKKLPNEHSSSGIFSSTLRKDDKTSEVTKL